MLDTWGPTYGMKSVPHVGAVKLRRMSSRPMPLPTGSSLRRAMSAAVSPCAVRTARSMPGASTSSAKHAHAALSTQKCSAVQPP